MGAKGKRQAKLKDQIEELTRRRKALDIIHSIVSLTGILFSYVGVASLYHRTSSLIESFRLYHPSLKCSELSTRAALFLFVSGV